MATPELTPANATDDSKRIVFVYGLNGSVTSCTLSKAQQEGRTLIGGDGSIESVRGYTGIPNWGSSSKKSE